MNVPVPQNEAERVKALRLYQILDTLPEDAFDEITQLAAHICGCPIATVSIIDEHRQWYKSKIGLDLVETPRDMAFCSHTILEDKPLIVEDTTLDERFASNPVVVGGPKVRFYAGVPLTNKDGYALGTLCVVDLKTRQLTEEQTLALGALSRHVVTHLELRRALIERSLAEAEVHSLNESLERRVGERTAELNAANTSLQLANRAKTDFLTNMSHEIRTPLNGIIGMTDLMLGLPLEGEQKDFVETIHSNGEHLLAIVNDVLDFSKIEFGSLELDLGPFDLVATMEDVSTMFRFRAAQKNLKVASAIDPALPARFVGDAKRIGQVLVNLVSNAIKFTEQGSVLIEVAGLESRPGDDPCARRLLFKVHDTGIGIPPDRLDALFQEFSQVDTSTTRKYGGSGLGLAICRKMADLMKGVVRVESKPDHGSVFSFEVPVTLVACDSALKALPAPAVPAATSTEGLPLPALTILLVEDNPTNQKVACNILKRLGQQAIVAGNGAEAVQATQLRGYDLILMDVHMPVLDGFDATRRIRQQEVNGHRSRIVALTADVLKGEREKCLEAGMDDYTTKPVKIDVLRQILADVVVKPGIEPTEQVV